MKIYQFENKEKLYDEVLKLYINRIASKPNICLGLATGSTPIPLYKKMVESYRRQFIDFKNVKAFNLDEYIGLPKGHKETYYYYMRKNLFDLVNINLDNTFIPDDSSRIDEFQNKLNENPIDLQLLGIGSNGHIGFNEPGTSFDSITQVIELDQKTREDNARFFNKLEEVPTHAITMGIKDIMKAKEIIIIATGDSKKEAIYQMVRGQVDESCPASILQKHPNVHLFVDNEASSLLKGGRNND